MTVLAQKKAMYRPKALAELQLLFDPEQYRNIVSIRTQTNLHGRYNTMNIYDKHREHTERDGRTRE